MFFSIYVLNLPLSTRQQTHLHFNTTTTTTVSLGLRSPFNIQTLTALHRNYSATQFKNSILVSTHFSTLENESQISNISTFQAILEDGSVKTSTLFGNRSTKTEIVSSKDLEIVSVNSSVLTWKQQNVSITLSKKGEVSSDVLKALNNKKECDIPNGKWVFDESYPLYTNASCPYIDEGFSCESNGRLDKNYMKWRWQPQDCDIPR